jgi:hypothetical protein
MSNTMRRSLFLALAVVAGFGLVSNSLVLSQSRRQPPSSDQKKNKRPDEKPESDEQKPEPTPPDIMGKQQEAERSPSHNQPRQRPDAVVLTTRSTGQPQIQLKKDNFAIFVDGVKKDITNFSTPEAPITATLVVEFSKTMERIGLYGNGGMDYGQMEVIRPTAMFLSQFITPTDYVSVIAYDMRPTPLVDFTNDPNRIQQVISRLLHNQPAFSESNLYDALKLTLVGGRGLCGARRLEAANRGLLRNGCRARWTAQGGFVDCDRAGHLQQDQYGPGAEDCAERWNPDLHHRRRSTVR